MKNKLKRVKFVVINILIVIILLGAIFLIMRGFEAGEPHFRITKKGVNVDKINLCDFRACENNYSVIISRQDLTKEWLDENCEWNGSYSKYKCGDYFVEVWNQIK